MRLIDADALGNRMYHESFEKDSDLQRWDGGCWIRYKLFEQVLRAAPTIDPTHPTPSNTLRALDCVERRLVSYKLTDLVNEFEEILSHIREREENDSVCGLCEYDGAYMGQSGDWCNECPGFDKADCFKLKDKYKKEWLELMNTLPSAQPDIIRCRNCKFASGDSRICMKFGHSPIGELDFCAWAERRTDE